LKQKPFRTKVSVTETESWFKSGKEQRGWTWGKRSGLRSYQKKSWKSAKRIAIRTEVETGKRTISQRLKLPMLIRLMSSTDWKSHGKRGSDGNVFMTTLPRRPTYSEPQARLWSPPTVCAERRGVSVWNAMRHLLRAFGVFIPNGKISLFNCLGRL